MGTVASDHGYTLELDDDGNAIARYKYRTFRFLFDSGKVIDVFAIRNDSWLADDLLKLTKETRIVGTTEVPDLREVSERPEVPTKPLKDIAEIDQTERRAPVKKAAAKKAAGGVKKQAPPRRTSA